MTYRKPPFLLRKWQQLQMRYYAYRNPKSWSGYATGNDSVPTPTSKIPARATKKSSG